jgi:hypothetical protein
MSLASGWTRLHDDVMRWVLVAVSVLAGCKAANGDTCVAPTGPSGAGCEAYFCGGELATDWMTTQLATGFCAPSPPERGGQLYSSCTSIGSSPDQCVGLAAGQQVCRGWALTALCEHDSDCPAGSRCHPDFGQLGTCQKTCSAAGNGDCGRCDLACDTTLGLCVRPGPGYPTNVPCDSTHAAIAVTLTLPQPFLSASLTLTVPGASPTVFSLLPGTTAVTAFYPSGATTGAASASFEGETELARLGGAASFHSDPTACTAVTVPVTVTQGGVPDAGL